MAINVAMNELKNLVESRRVSEAVGRRYVHALRCIASGANTWGSLLNCLQRSEGHNLEQCPQ